MISYTRALFLTAILYMMAQPVYGCAVCLGKDNEGYLPTIMLPVGVFLIAPFIVFLIILFSYRRLINKEQYHE